MNIVRLIALLIFWIIPLMVSCGGEATSSDSENLPIVKNLPVLIEDYDANTGLAGDVDFTHSELGETEKIFLEFNGLLIDGGSGPEGVRLPHFIFNLPPGTPVYFMTDGTVTFVGLNDNSPDYEVRVTPAGASAHTATYDHVDNVLVQAGDAIEAGDQIGEAVENKFEADVATDDISTCPVDFFDADAADDLKNKLSTLMSDWEAFKGDTTIYNEEEMYAVGCFSESGDL
ncbi:MAG: M23 family metallopeptidase [Deltaproteobacteria bacterium]|nr:M23 family metallopeptidase [Deltaproteobacteria bacterium]